MPAYHSQQNEAAAHYTQIGNMAILPIKTSMRGPAMPPEDPNADDIVSEAISLFRANSLFRNYEIYGPADRVLVYLILFISDCLSRIASPQGKAWTPNEAHKQLQSTAVDAFALPGDPGFPINTMYDPPANRQDADLMRSYLTQARQETASRLVAIVYADGAPSKWWLAFTKRKFMGKAL